MSHRVLNKSMSGRARDYMPCGSCISLLLHQMQCIFIYFIYVYKQSIYNKPVQNIRNEHTKIYIIIIQI